MTSEQVGKFVDVGFVTSLTLRQSAACITNLWAGNCYPSHAIPLVTPKTGSLILWSWTGTQGAKSDAGVNLPSGVFWVTVI